MSNRKYPYDKMEVEYITNPSTTLRGLAEKYGVKTHSLVMDQSKSREWVRKREEYQRKADERTSVVLADREARRRARQVEVFDNALEAIDEAITNMRSQLQQTTKVQKDGQWVEQPLIIVRPQDLAILIDRLNVLFGRPSNITEERSLGINLDTAEPELLRGFVEATRGVGPVNREPSGTPFPRTGSTRPT